MLIIAYLLPWITGSLCLAWLQSFSRQPGNINLPRVLGYGFFLGNFICTVVVYLVYSASAQLSFVAIAAVQLFLSCVFLLLLWKKQDYKKPPFRITWPDLGGNRKKWVVLLLVLIAVHILFAGYDALGRPLLPWDAWTTWTYRAKIWFLNQELSPFVGADSWLGSMQTGTYTLPAHAYPLVVSLIQLWPALAQEQWHDAAAIFPGLLAGIALLLALYGQARSLGCSPLLALIGGYLLISIPLLDAHLALPGYADVWLSGFAGLGFVALLQWSQSRSRIQLATGLLFLGLGLFIKREGSLWLMMGLLFILLQSLSWKYVFALGLAMLLAIFSDNALINIPWLGQLGYANGAFYLPGLGAIILQPQNAPLAVINNLFINDSWNLLFFYLFTMLVLLLLPTGKKPRQSLVSFLVLLSMVIAAVFFLSSKGEWLKDSTAFGRLLLQMLPALVFVLIVYWQAIFPQQRTSPGNGE